MEALDDDDSWHLLLSATYVPLSEIFDEDPIVYIDPIVDIDDLRFTTAAEDAGSEAIMMELLGIVDR